MAVKRFYRHAEVIGGLPPPFPSPSLGGGKGGASRYGDLTEGFAGGSGLAGSVSGATDLGDSVVGGKSNFSIAHTNPCITLNKMRRLSQTDLLLPLPRTNLLSSR